MFIKSSRLNPLHQSYFKVHLRRLKILVHQLCKKRNARAESIEMEIKNLRLIIENQSIVEENENLRKRALQLQQENKDLLSQLHKANDHFDKNQ